MVSPGGGNREAQPRGPLAPGLVGGQLLPLDLHGVLSGAPPDRFRGPPGALGQHVSETFAAGDPADHFQEQVRIVPPQPDTPGVLLGEQAPLEALHRPGEGDSSGDRVQTQGVAQLVGLHHRHTVFDAQLSPQRGDRFVLWSPVLPGHPVLSPFAFHQALAGHGAGIAGAAARADHVLQGLPRQTLGRVERAVLMVEGRQVSRVARGKHSPGGAVVVHEGKPRFASSAPGVPGGQLL